MIKYFKNNPAILIMMLFVVVLITLFACCIISTNPLKSFLQADSCLDSGGTYDERSSSCIYATPRPIPSIPTPTLLVDQEITLKLFRKNPDFVYLVDTSQPPLAYYYRVKDVMIFNDNAEGDDINLKVGKFIQLNPVQNYMVGIKDYTVPISYELMDVEIVPL